MASDDPEFESKAADILGLYLHPPQHVRVLSMKTAIQALDRLDPVLLLLPGRAERHGFEYFRHGTLSLYAALDTKTGRVHGKTAARHTSRDFVAFLEEVVSRCLPRQQVHIILDNLSAHKTQLVRDFLQRHPSSFTSRPPIPRGSTKSRSGSPKSSARSSLAEFLPRSPIWLANFGATSSLTRPTLAPSAGNTLTLLAAYLLTNSLRQSTSYKEATSFISTGPLRWIDDESDFAPTIYVSLPRILRAVDEVEERIGRIVRTASVRITDLATSPKHLLFFLCDLIAVIHPATGDVVQYYLQHITPSLLSSDISVPTLLGLATAMGLLRTKTLTVNSNDLTYYLPANSAAIERPYHHTRLLDLPSQRAAHAAVLLTVPEARNVLAALVKLP